MYTMVHFHFFFYTCYTGFARKFFFKFSAPAQMIHLLYFCLRNGIQKGKSNFTPLPFFENLTKVLSSGARPNHVNFIFPDSAANISFINDLRRENTMGIPIHDAVGPVSLRYSLQFDAIFDVCRNYFVHIKIEETSTICK